MFKLMSFCPSFISVQMKIIFLTVYVTVLYFFYQLKLNMLEKIWMVIPAILPVLCSRILRKFYVLNFNVICLCCSIQRLVSLGL